MVMLPEASDKKEILLATSEHDNRCARVFPRRKAGEIKRAKTKPLVLTKEMLTMLFDRPLKQAATSLGVSATALKGICRKLEIHRWPFQQTRWLAVRGSEDMPEQAPAQDQSASKLAQGHTDSNAKNAPTFEAMLGQCTFHDDSEPEDTFNNKEMLKGCNSPPSCLHPSASAEEVTPAFRPVSSSYQNGDAEAAANGSRTIPAQHGHVVNAHISQHNPTTIHEQQQQRELDMHMHSRAWNAWYRDVALHSSHDRDAIASQPVYSNTSQLPATHSLRHALGGTPPTTPADAYAEASTVEHMYVDDDTEQQLNAMDHSNCDLSFLCTFQM